MTIAFCEITDTFGGETNYSWVRRAEVSIVGAGNRAVVRRAKKALGVSGERTITHDFGDSIQLDFVGQCKRAFITFASHEDYDKEDEENLTIDLDGGLSAINE